MTRYDTHVISGVTLLGKVIRVILTSPDDPGPNFRFYRLSVTRQGQAFHRQHD
jgi:hypothetical protein